MMKSLLFFSTLLFAFTTATVNVDTEASQITWKGYKVTGSHEGTINVENGELAFDEGVLTGGSFDINMGSITVTDLQGGMAQKLEGHLKSPDFFGVEKFPTATFNITKVVSRGTAGAYRITGDLKIKETTKTIRFNANVEEKEG
ncbi:MAG: YceI family protein, partial [Bacteroidota bacterium]